MKKKKYLPRKIPIDENNERNKLFKKKDKEYFHKVKITKKTKSNTPKYEKKSSDRNFNNSSVGKKKSKKTVYLYRNNTIDDKLTKSNQFERLNSQNKTNYKKTNSNVEKKDLNFDNISDIEDKNEVEAHNSREENGNNKKIEEKNPEDININKEEKDDLEEKNDNELENKSKNEKENDNLDEMDNNLSHNDKINEKMENIEF